MRLIDADKCPCVLCEDIRNAHCTYEHRSCEKFCHWLNNTAYDVDKVVEDLEEEYVDCQKNMNLVKDEDGNEAGHIYDEYLNKSIAYETAINIVKQKIDNGL